MREYSEDSSLKEGGSESEKLDNLLDEIVQEEKDRYHKTTDRKLGAPLGYSAENTLQSLTERKTAKAHGYNSEMAEKYLQISDFVEYIIDNKDYYIGEMLEGKK